MLGILLMVFPVILSAQEEVDTKNTYVIKTVSEFPAPSGPNAAEWTGSYILARFGAKGEQDPAGVSFIPNLCASGITPVSARDLIRLHHLYTSAGTLPGITKKVLETGFLPGQMSFFNQKTRSENQLTLTLSGDYLLCQMAVEENIHAREAKIRMTGLKSGVLQKAKSIFAAGNGEWNSGLYESRSITAWLNLYDFAKDPEIKSVAWTMLDYYATSMALHFSWGVPGGAEMRGADVWKNSHTASAFLGWFWFSRNEIPVEKPGTQLFPFIHFTTSAYRPNDAVIALALKQLTKPFECRLQWPDYSGSKPGFCSNSFYATHHFTLGSMTSSYGGWADGSSEMIPWKLVARPENPVDRPFQISGNGMFHSAGKGRGRDPFTQIAQSENVLFQLTRFPLRQSGILAEISKMTKVWQKSGQFDFGENLNSMHAVPKSEPKPRTPDQRSVSHLILDQRGRATLENGVCFVEFEGTYIAIRSIQQEYPLSEDIPLPQNEGQGFEWMKDEAPTGKLSGFVIETGDFGSHGSFNAFKNAIRKSVVAKPTADHPLKVGYTDTRGRVLEVTFQSSGTSEEVFFPDPNSILPVWPTGESHGKKATITINGQEIPKHEGVFQGSVLELQNGILRLHINGKTFESHP